MITISMNLTTTSQLSINDSLSVVLSIYTDQWNFIIINDSTDTGSLLFNFLLSWQPNIYSLQIQFAGNNQFNYALFEMTDVLHILRIV